MQAAIGHPLTVHGTGGQTRAFIHIRDTVRCIEIALNNPPEKGSKVLVRNQITETHRVLDLAKMIGDITGTEIAFLPNPRVEADENELIVRNDQFLALGLQPTTLSEGLLEEITEIAAKYRDRVDPHKIIARSVWRAGMETSADLMTEVPAADVKRSSKGEPAAAAPGDAGSSCPAAFPRPPPPGLSSRPSLPFLLLQPSRHPFRPPPRAKLRRRAATVRV